MTSDTGCNSREFVTEVLEESGWRNALATIVHFLSEKGVEYVRVEFGFVVQRDLRGEAIPDDQTVALNKLESFVERGLEQGIIEWAGTSDFMFSAVGADANFMLCNDADLHVSSSDLTFLKELSGAVTASGVKVYE
jgi:hypothetical protein